MQANIADSLDSHLTLCRKYQCTYEPLLCTTAPRKCTLASKHCIGLYCTTSTLHQIAGHWATAPYYCTSAPLHQITTPLHTWIRAPNSCTFVPLHLCITAPLHPCTSMAVLACWCPCLTEGDEMDISLLPMYGYSTCTVSNVLYITVLSLMYCTLLYFTVLSWT